MASTITAGNATNGLAVSCDNTGILELKTGTGSGTTAVTIGTGQDVTFAQAANLPNTFGFKNRIINGAMVIDQRNAGASVTPTANTYTVDRWLLGIVQASKLSVQRNAGSVTPPTGFTNYLGLTSTSAYSVLSGDSFIIQQRIEGFNVADLAWGTAGAASVIVSFKARSSLTGTHSGAIRNSAADRAYPFSFTINAANTWEDKVVTIPGDTSGTWLTDNGIGLILNFSLGAGSSRSGTAGAWTSGNIVAATGAVSVVGTNGATFYITGVQLEKGSTATSFDVRPYGTELMLCQRYYYKTKPGASAKPFAVGYNNSTTAAIAVTYFPNPMRISPTALEQSGTASHYTVRVVGGEVNCSSAPTFTSASNEAANTTFTVSSGLTAGYGTISWSNHVDAFLAWSAEL